ncbi:MULTISPECIES: TetR/AcrR family transcriptional regulator [Marinobacterium]|jgi:TetR/AcrR family transcriptional repressor of cmeABC operon|nr:TetR/AcrR family transcriptional regulator [Marinobacterium iners]
MNKMQQDEKTTACGLTPKGLERQKRILDAAREVFLEQGYDNASINDIMCRAGGSLSTLYRLFGSKLGLFEAMMEQTSNQVFAAFQAFECSIKRQETPEQALKRYARLLLERVLSPEAVGLYRLITTDCSSEREQIQQLFYAQGPKRINEKLAGYLRVQVEQGVLQINNPELAAFQFVDMVKGQFQLRAMLGMTITDGELDAAVEQAVDIFLRGTTPR